MTDDGGRYAITGLTPANYEVVVYSAGYALRWFPNAYDAFAATAVAVPPGGTAGDINVTLEVGASITGIVTTAEGVPIADATVVVKGAGDEPGASTDADGS